MPTVTRRALTASILCLIGFGSSGAIALLVPAARAHDTATLNAFMALGHTRAAALADTFTRLVDPPGFLLFAVVFVAVALLRGRPRVALMVAVMMLLAIASAELLKPLIGASHDPDWLTGHAQLHDGSWPSGHVTAAMVVALGAVIAAPRSLRPAAAALGTVLAVGVGYSVLLLSWHLPSDVLGGLLLAAAWACAGVALLSWADARWPARAGRRAITRGIRHPLVPAFAVLAGLGAAIAVFIGRGQLAGASAVAPASFTVAAIAIAAVAGSLAAGLAFVLRR